MKVEDTVILSANTVIDPRAMMIETVNTLITDRAMTASWWLQDFAVLAKCSRLERFKHFHEFIFIHFLLDHRR